MARKDVGLVGLENLPDSGVGFDTGPAKAFNRKDREGLEGDALIRAFGSLFDLGAPR